jgi:3-phosphoshikimate 1-carboxyvinyltransferase
MRISKKDRRLEGIVDVPASKSICNRLLIIRSLCASPFRINNLSESGDTALLVSLLERIGKGGGDEPVVLDCGNAGTVMRFLTARLSVEPGRWLLTGSERMKQRPLGGLVNALKKLGCRITYQGLSGFPPVLIEGRNIRGGRSEVEAGTSSQFITALLLIAPLLPEGMMLRIRGTLTSLPYVLMTIYLMQHFGIQISLHDNLIAVEPGIYISKDIAAEADWTSASYWYEAAALSTEADVIIGGLVNSALQGDMVLREMYRSFGIETVFREEGVRLTKRGAVSPHVSFDFTHHPDLVPAVAVTCAGLKVRARLSGLDSLRVKETDRIAALHTELTRMSAAVHTADPPALLINPSGLTIKEPVRTYGDHRMALSFAPLALTGQEITLDDPSVTAKSYPRFWENLEKLGFTLSF